MVRTFNMSKDILLECNKLTFYSHGDEKIFLEWLKKIPIIEQVYREGNDFRLSLAKKRPSRDELRNLVALFRRYSIELQQLNIFIDDENKDWFTRWLAVN